MQNLVRCSREHDVSSWRGTVAQSPLVALGMDAWVSLVLYALSTRLSNLMRMRRAYATTAPGFMYKGFSPCSLSSRHLRRI